MPNNEYKIGSDYMLITEQDIRGKMQSILIKESTKNKEYEVFFGKNKIKLLILDWLIDKTNEYVRKTRDKKSYIISDGKENINISKSDYEKLMKKIAYETLYYEELS